MDDNYEIDLMESSSKMPVNDGLNVSSESLGGSGFNREGEGILYDTETPQIEQLNTPKQINVRPLNSGYILSVGCQEIAVESTSNLIKALTIYLNNPNETEKAWFSGPDQQNRLNNIF